MLSVVLVACGSPETNTGVDKCDPDMTPCPADVMDNCTPETPITGTCCYETPKGDHVPIGLCAQP